MKIALINGSPKKKGSASQTLLKELSVYLSEDTKSSNYQLIHPEVPKETAEALVDFDVLVFAFPLYVDGVPSHLLACLQQLEKAGLKRETRVYCIVNSGFYEGEQNEYAVQVVRNWCARAGLIWGMGIGYGGGGALTHLQGCPPGNGPKKSLGDALQKLAAHICAGESAQDYYCSINFPRWLYKLSAEMNWKKQIQGNGGKKRDLDRRM